MSLKQDLIAAGLPETSIATAPGLMVIDLRGKPEIRPGLPPPVMVEFGPELQRDPAAVAVVQELLDRQTVETEVKPMGRPHESSLTACEVPGCCRVGVKTDGNGRVVCYHHASGFQEPIRYTDVPIGRNDACSCGSGKRFKKCCRNRPAPV